MKSFIEFTGTSKIYETSVLEPERLVVFTWGRFNPPTKGHQLVFDRANALAEERGASFYIFTSQTHDDDKNPLTYEQKIKTLKRYFPQYSNRIVSSTNVKTLSDVINTLKDKGFTKGILMVGQDRVDDFENFFSSINIGDDFKVVSAGPRMTNTSDVKSVSGQMLRDFVRDGEIEKFRKTSPSGVRPNYIDDVYHTIRRHYGIESQQKSEPIEIDTTEQREQFYNGQYQDGDKVLINKTNQIGTIDSVGSNYLNISVLGETKVKKIWASEVQKL